MNFVREYYLSDIGICDRLIELFRICKKLGLTDQGLVGKHEFDKKIKDSEDLGVERIPTGNPLIPTPADSGYHSVIAQFHSLIPRYYSDTNAHWRQEVAFKAFPHFQYYRAGGGYHSWHCDAAGDDVDRHLVFILYLNDVPNGGTEFFHQKYVCEAKKGKILMFPANFCYPHRSQVSTTHEKYILTGWARAKMSSNASPAASPKSQ